jgi:hypothetical protein
MLVRGTGEVELRGAGLSERISLVLYLRNNNGWWDKSVVLGGVQVLLGS